MNTRIAMADPAAEYRLFKEDIDAAVGRVLASGRYVLGPEGEALERELEAFTGARRRWRELRNDALHLAWWRRCGSRRRSDRSGFTFSRHAKPSLMGATPSSPTSSRVRSISRCKHPRAHHGENARRHCRSLFGSARR